MSSVTSPMMENIAMSDTDSAKKQKDAALNPDVDYESKDLMTRPVKTCLVLSLSFTFIYTAYLAIQNLQSSLNQAAHLGTTSLSVLYGTIIIFGTQAPTILKFLGAKWVLVIAWIAQTIYTACNFYPTWGTLVPASALLGAVAGPMWTAQGIYITAAGEAYAALQGEASEGGLHAVLSRFNGIFFMFYEVTQVTGNLISSLVLQTSSHNSSSDSTKVCGPSDCPNAGNSSSEIEEPERSVVYTLLGVFLACNVCGLLLTLIFLPKYKASSKDSPSVSIRQEMGSCFRMAVDSRMILLLPLFMGQAMAIGVLYADYTKAFISCALGIEWVGYVMTSYGIFTALFAVSINWLAPIVGRVFLFSTAILIDTGTLIAMLVWHPTDESTILFFLVPAVSGIAEGIMQAQFNTLIAQVFKDDLAPAFATYHTAKAASFTLTFALSSLVCLRERLYVSIAMYAAGLIGYIITEIRLRRKKVYDMKSEIDQTVDEKLTTVNKLEQISGVNNQSK